MHVWLSLPAAVESGAVRILQQDKEIVVTDGGYEVRNSRWSSPLRSWQAAYGVATSGDATHAAVEAMWRSTNAGADSFNFADFKTGDTARVRFDADLQFTNEVGSLYHLDTFTLKEVRDISPVPTAAPAITGTPHPGNTLTVSNGSWSGSPTSFAYQWLANEVPIPGAIASTYVVASGDVGKLIGCQVVATDAYGGSTANYAADVGPVA